MPILTDIVDSLRLEQQAREVIYSYRLCFSRKVESKEMAEARPLVLANHVGDFGQHTRQGAKFYY